MPVPRLQPIIPAKMRADAQFNAKTVTSAAPMVGHTAWQSPALYLFGALAGVLCLIALPLLILVCSFWKLSRSQDDDRECAETPEGQAYLVPGVAVIMAGDENPTILARPTARRAKIFGEHSYCCGEKKGGNIKIDGVDDDEKKLDGDSGFSLSTEMENQN